MMNTMAQSLFVWLKRCCRKLPLTDQLRVGSGAGYEPARRSLPAVPFESDADEEYCSDTKVSSTVFAAPALHTAVADRLT